MAANIRRFSMWVLTRVLVLQSCLVLMFVSTGTSGANILVTLFHPMSIASHNLFTGRVTSGLVSRNHTVTAVMADTYDSYGLREGAVSNIIKFKARKPPVAGEFGKQAAESRDDVGIKQIFMEFTALGGIAHKNCEDMFRDEEFMNELRRQKFDLILLGMFSLCDALLAESLKVPFVVITASHRYPFFDEDVFHVELPSSYVPFLPMDSLTDEMGFMERVKNFLNRHVFLKAIQYMNMFHYRTIQLEHNISVGSSVRELAGKGELWLCQIDFALDFPHPTAPNVIPIGGITAGTTPKPLPQDLEDFVLGSDEHGVIVFSLGSAGAKLLSDERAELFAAAFSELPQRVVWRWKGSDPPRRLGNNTRLLKWLPQADLLAHPKTRLIIYHGGLNGVYEAIRHKVPMVLMPLFADQPSISARVAKKGMGVVLQKSQLSVEKIKAAIERVLHDPSYQANVDRFGSIHLDTIASPLDTAMFWIEHVIKFGGSHLRSRAGELNFFVLNSLDVASFFLVIMFLALYLDYLILRACFRRFCKKTISKPKSD